MFTRARASGSAQMAVLMVCLAWLAVGCEEPKPVKTIAPATQPTTRGALPGLTAVAISLPKPAFIGTRKDVPLGYVLEPARKGPRAPLQAPAGVVNLAAKRPVTGSDTEPLVGKLEMVTDGDKEALDGRSVELGPGKQWVQIDLGKAGDVWGIVIWHRHSDPRIYKDVLVQVCDDLDFITNVQAVYNNDIDNSLGMGIGKDLMYAESYEGKLIETQGQVKGRYVRLYSNGGTEGDTNHYTEVEVYGVPGK